MRSLQPLITAYNSTAGPPSKHNMRWGGGVICQSNMFLPRPSAHQVLDSVRPVASHRARRRWSSPAQRLAHGTPLDCHNRHSSETLLHRQVTIWQWSSHFICDDLSDGRR